MNDQQRTSLLKCVREHADPETRYRAVLELGTAAARDGKCAEALVEAVRSGKGGTIRLAALEKLDTLPRLPAGAVQAYASAVQDRSVELRVRALAGVSRLPRAEANDVLLPGVLKAAAASNAEVRDQARDAYFWLTGEEWPPRSTARAVVAAEAPPRGCAAVLAVLLLPIPVAVALAFAG